MKIAIIGCGVIGSILARQLSKEHVILLHDRNESKAQPLIEELKGIFLPRAEDAVRGADIVILAVKPKDLPELSKKIADAFSQEQILLSILAGTSLSLLKSLFKIPSVIRMMANIAMICREGIIGLVEDSSIDQEKKKTAESLFLGLGLVRWLDEHKIDALSALTASGPAFILVFIEAMIEGGIAMGFTSEQAKDFVLKTFEGTVELIYATKQHPAEIKWQITSPAGMTIAGLKELEEMAVRSAVMKALLSAYHKAKTMQ